MPSRLSVRTVSATGQRGAALLLLLLLIVVGVLAVFVTGAKRAAQQQERDRITSEALAQAKAALIGWSVAGDTPGQLPCPEDVSAIGGLTEGQAASSCPLPAVGRLPWRTLKLGDLRDGYGEKLWYVISNGFRSPPINSDTPAQLTIDGIAGSAVAMVLSPGPVLSGQTRPPPSAASPPNIAQYLDLSNNDGDNAYVTEGSPTVFNDRLLRITRENLFGVVEKRVLRTVTEELNRYFSENNFFPRPASFGDAGCLGGATIASGCNSAASGDQGRIPANPVISWYSCSMLRGEIGAVPCKNWFQQNGWRELVYYAAAPACIDGTVGCNGAGLLAAGSVPNVRALVILSGRAITTAPFAVSNGGAQTRPSTSLADYLDSMGNTNMDDIFDAVGTARTSSYNDQTHIVAP